MEDASIKGKIVIQGELHLKSPMIIGSGQDEFADIEVIKDSKGNPFIPATSLTGVISHYFDENYPERLKEKYQFFGYSRKNDNEKHESFQSAFICHDLHAQKALIRIRDGVKIDPSSQTAEDMGKYDFEIIEKGAVFDLFWEITIRDIHDPDTFKQILATMISPLKEGTLPMGAKTNSGFGKCKLKKLCISHFDFSKKDDVFRWLKQDFSKGTPKLDCKPFEPENHNKIFCIEARFAIKSSLIVRSYSEEANMPDATSITSNGKYVLPGTSVKGAIRHRALKILKTLEIDDAQERIYNLFGDAGKNIVSKKGRVLIEEKNIKMVYPEIQNRIKIDRFTGGTIKTALFNSMPLWSKDHHDESVTIIIKIRNYKEWEAGLMLHVLKDLWSEDLPIGGEKNIGRGILKGICACIKWDGKCLKIETDDDKGLIFSDESHETELNQFAEKVKVVA
ncbi:MAG: hypothetical protein E4G94_01305 [ANME-2 cluster archaeon]|nr:MAG: hypothetical protein E4G94_01305 [ANME-2 cluster archaeon]